MALRSRCRFAMADFWRSCWLHAAERSLKAVIWSLKDHVASTPTELACLTTAATSRLCCDIFGKLSGMAEVSNQDILAATGGVLWNAAVSLTTSHSEGFLGTIMVCWHFAPTPGNLGGQPIWSWFKLVLWIGGASSLKVSENTSAAAFPELMLDGL